MNSENQIRMMIQSLNRLLRRKYEMFHWKLFSGWIRLWPRLIEGPKKDNIPANGAPTST